MVYQEHNFQKQLKNLKENEILFSVEVFWKIEMGTCLLMFHKY